MMRRLWAQVARRANPALPMRREGAPAGASSVAEVTADVGRSVLSRADSIRARVLRDS